MKVRRGLQMQGCAAAFSHGPAGLEALGLLPRYCKLSDSRNLLALPGGCAANSHHSALGIERVRRKRRRKEG